MTQQRLSQTIKESLITTQQHAEINQQPSTQHRSFLSRTFGPLGKGSMRSAILTMLASAMGTGIFNLPQRVQQIGVIPFIILVLSCGFYSYIGMKLISEMIVQKKIKSYSDMTEKAYGNILKRFSEFCLIIYPWGITICFQVILAKFSIQLLYDVFEVPLYNNKKDRQDDLYNQTGNLVRILINIGTIIISMVFILKRQIDTIKKLSYLGVVSVLFNVGVVVVTSFVGFTRMDENDKPVVYNGIFNRQKGSIKWFQLDHLNDTSVLLQGTASIFFCYVCHQMIYPLVQDFHNPTKKRLNKIFKRSHFILLTVYTTIGLFTYLLLLENEDIFKIEPLAIASITTTIMDVGKFIMVLALFAAISLNMFPARQVFLETFNIDNSSNKIHILVCTGLAGCSTIVAITFVQINSYFGLLGGTAGVMMAGGIPAICYMKLMPLKKSHYFLVLFIFLITMLAMIGAVLSVVRPV